MEWYQQPLWKWREDRAQGCPFSERRDTQVSRVYRSEDFLRYHQIKGRSFSSVEQIQDYVDALTATVWFIKRFGAGWNIEASVKCAGHAIGSNHSDRRGTIQLPPDWAFEEWVILHEIGHAVGDRRAGGGHGRYFARCYLELVRYRMGVKVHDLLKKAYKAGGVKFSPKRPPSVISAKCASKRPTNLDPRQPSNREKALAELNQLLPENLSIKRQIALAANKVARWNFTR